MNIAAIDWRAREVLGSGAFGVVYRVAPGIVAKVGLVLPDEAERQSYLATIGLALPVLDYDQHPALPEALVDEADTSVEHPLTWCAVLVMPEAEPLFAGSFDDLDDEAQAQIDAEVEALNELLVERNVWWDDHEYNVARYQGRIVALDFGGPYWPSLLQLRPPDPITLGDPTYA